MQVESSAIPLLTQDKASSLYLVSSARLIPAESCNWWKKRKDFAMCTALRKCALCSPCFRMERGHGVDRASYTL